MKISYLTMLLSGILLSLLTGCSKDAETDSSEMGNKQIPIHIVVKGYQDFDEKGSGTRSVSDETEIEVVRQDLDIPGYEDYEILTTVEKTPIREIQTRASMNENSYFNMFVYNSAGVLTGNWIYQMVGGTPVLYGGTTENGPVLEEGVYKFVCYTYNIEYVEDVLTNIPVANGDDFATCHSVQMISAENNTVSLFFVRQMSQFKITATATGFNNNNVTIGGGVVSGMYADGKITLGANSSMSTPVEGIGSAILPFDGNTPTKVIPVARTKEFTLNNIVIDGENRGSKKITIASSFEKGRNYNINVSLTRKNGFLVGGVEWSTGSLQYANGAYFISNIQDHFTGVNGFTWNANANPDYYSFYTLTPTSTSLNNGDPCSRVAPAGSWRLPTKVDFEATMRTPYIDAVNSNGVYGFFFDVTEVPSAAEENKTLFFPAAGYRYPADNKFYDARDGNGFYWSSTSLNAGNAYYLFLSRDHGPSVLTGSKNTGFTIRCVKR